MQDFLVAYCVRVVSFHTGAVSRASKWGDCIVERATSVPIETAVVASRPAVLSCGREGLRIGTYQ